MRFKIRFLGHIDVVIMDYNLVDTRKIQGRQLELDNKLEH